MPIQHLAHYAVRTRDLDASRRFYEGVLGLRVGPRPPFPFPGLWLYAGDEAFGTVHLIGEGMQDDAVAAYLGRRPPAGSRLDHVAFNATGWPVIGARLEAHRVPYDERRVPLLGQRQVFLRDPCGVPVELTFSDGL